MNMERAQMRVKLANLQQREKRLRLEIDGLCTTIRANLNTALTPIESLDILETEGLMGDLTAVWGNLQVTLSEISRLKGDLA